MRALVGGWDCGTRARGIEPRGIEPRGLELWAEPGGWKSTRIP